MMEKALLLLAIGFAVPLFRRILKECRMRREVRTRFNNWMPVHRSIPLSRQDRRGWATDPDGVIRPR